MPSCLIETPHNLKEGLIESNHNKIRKRDCSSSSSSSLVRRRRYKFKRAILVGKKGGSSTPVPMWKTMTNSPPNMATTHQVHHDQVKREGDLHHHSSSASGVPFFRDRELSVSARKLAATLWEINDLPPPTSVKKKDLDVEDQMMMMMMRGYKEAIRGKEKAVSLSRSGLLQQPHVSDPSNSPNSERLRGFEDDRCKRRVSDYYVDAHSSASLIEEAENQQRSKNSCGKCAVGFKNRLKEARSGLSTSKKLVKVLNQVCLREQHSSSMPLVLALGSNLDWVCHQIDQLIQEQRANQNDIEHITKRFAEEKAAWKRREREKIHGAIRNVAEELEVEKKLRRQTERLNKKIAREMAEEKASHLRACKELEREKRAKEILEQICDELARGIGEDRAQVEELKRESAKVREEVEKEREMLQLADVLREERVHMKLSEAKYQFEEKNAVLEKLRNELEGFMRTKEEDDDEDGSPHFKKIKDLESYFNEIYGGFHNAEKENGLDVGDGVEHEGDDDSDDDDSDLHSIELNMENDNSGYKWSYARANFTKDEPKRVSTDKESTGRKSCSEKIQWGSICFNKGTTSFRKRDFGTSKIQESFDRFDPETSLEFLKEDQTQDDKDEKDCVSCAKPVLRNGQPLTLQYSDGEAEENALALEAAARISRC